jgi:3-isopropylmalate dehydrogenase
LPSNRDVYARFVEAFNRGDLDTAIDLLHPEIEWDYTAGLARGVRHGTEEVRRLLTQLHHGWSDFSVALEQATVTDDRLVTVVRYSARGRTSGVYVERRLAELVAFQDGKLRSYRQFDGPDEALAAATEPMARAVGKQGPAPSSKRIAVLPGDGIGPEIMGPAREALERLGDFEFEEHVFGGASIDVHGTALADDVLEACRGADAVLLAAVGGPKWDTTDPHAPRPEQGLLGLRKGLGLYANLRPVRPLPALYDASPLRRERIEGTDLLVVRELTGGIYFGARGREEGRAFDTCEYSVEEIERIARTAFGAARSRVTSVDKANVLETSRLWRETVHELHDREFPHVQLEHLLVDNAAMQLIAAPRHFDVILTENMFGDILSDEAAMLTGSIGLLPSASLGDDGPGLFEPVHGSAPDIAGQGIANPLAMMLSAALMLRHGLGRHDEAAALESAVDRALDDGLRTRDLGGTASTAEAAATVLSHL